MEKVLATSHNVFADRCNIFNEIIHHAQKMDIYPYFRVIEEHRGTELTVNGRRLLMIGSNDYLGLSHHPLVKERSAKALEQWGCGTGGSRFLCGNLKLHEQLEERIAAFVGKKKAAVFSNGFGANLGAIGAILQRGDLVLVDRENHASVVAGCRHSDARMLPFSHNDAADAGRKLDRYADRGGQQVNMLICEGVYSMSGDLARLDAFVKLKRNHPGLLLYLDDAHGLGIMGPSGRGTAAYFDVAPQIDFIMGTFSKSFASVGGFIATDHADAMCFLMHQSKTFIFSAGLPAVNVATVLAALDVIEREPERVERVWELARRARAGFQELGLRVGTGNSPIIPIHIGDEFAAARFAADLFEAGVFALPSVYPAVPKSNAVIRAVFSAEHTVAQVDRVVEIFMKVCRRHPDIVDHRSVN